MNKKKSKKILVTITGVMLSFFLFEAILQITDDTNYNRFEIDQESGLLLFKKNIEFSLSGLCFKSTVLVNNYGLHGKTINKSKENTYRIIVLGGSFVESLQLPFEKMWVYRLENLLNQNAKGIRYEVIPIAFSANKTYDNLVFYERFAKNLSPDLVINLVTEYESREATINKDSLGNILFTKNFYHRLKVKDLVIRSIKKSKLIMNIDKKLQIIIDNNKNFFDRRIGNNSTIKESDYRWKIESELFKKLNEEININNSKLVLFSWPTPEATNEEKLDLKENLLEISRKNNFRYFDLENKIKDKETLNKESAVYSCDNHWSETGDEYAAESIYEYLKENKIIK